MAMKQAEHDDAEPYAELTLLGMVCLRDPLREDVAEAIAAARVAGVRVVMMTGDHADTAAAIASQAGLGADARDLVVIEGVNWLTSTLKRPMRCCVSVFLPLMSLPVLPPQPS